MALVTTIGGSTANSYISYDDATTFFDSRLNAETWYSTDETVCEKALKMAAQRLQRENWIGSRVTTTQAMAWPRSGAAKPDSDGDFVATGLIGVGWAAWYDTDEIPQEVKDAQCLLALALLNGYGQTNGQSIESFTADGVTVRFGDARSESLLPDEVTRLIGSLVRGNQLQRA